MKVMQIGLGRIGTAVTRLLIQKPDWHIVAAVDTDAAQQGRDLGQVVGLEHSLGIVVRETLPDVLDDIDIAFLTTVSSLPQIFPTLQALIQGGVDVVSSSEELFYPYHRYAEQALVLDHLAKHHKVSILGTGLAPGFIMDTLVLLLTVVCHDITRIAVTRVVNVSKSRPSLHRQIGLGLTPAMFAEQVAQRHVGVVGAIDSLAFLAHVLHWHMDDFRERLVPVIADKPWLFKQCHVAPGHVCGIRYVTKGMSHGKEVISFDLRMYPEAENTRDTIYIEGTPTLEMTLKGTEMEDTAAASLLVNMGALMPQARPGLLTMLDFPLPHLQR